MGDIEFGNKEIMLNRIRERLSSGWVVISGEPDVLAYIAKRCYSGDEVGNFEVILARRKCTSTRVDHGTHPIIICLAKKTENLQKLLNDSLLTALEISVHKIKGGPYVQGVVTGSCKDNAIDLAMKEFEEIFA
jgi:hypothetical protein